MPSSFFFFFAGFALPLLTPRDSPFCFLPTYLILQAEVLPELTTEVQALDESVGNVQAASVGLEDQVEAMKDQYLRLNADFDNFRKRTEKEKTQLSETTRGKFMEALLPVLDNFELAKANVKPESEEAEKVQSSYQVLYTQMMDLLSAQGLNVVDGVGSKFDPNIHEAIMKEESTEAEDDTVLEEFRKGYVIGEKLIRAAMVKVAVNPAGAAPAADGDAPADEEVKEQA